MSDSEGDYETSDEESLSDDPLMDDSLLHGDGDSYRSKLEKFDPVPTIETREDADRFVESAIRHAPRRAQVDALRDLVLGRLIRYQRRQDAPGPQKRARQFGGSSIAVLAKFFELVDAVHDFGDDAVHDFGVDHTRQVALKDSLGAQLPLNLKNQGLGNLVHYDRLFENLARDETLEFPDGTVVDPNPCVNIEADIYKHVPGDRIRNKQAQPDGLVRNEHLFLKIRKKATKIVVLTSVTRIRRSMDLFYPGGGPIKMMIDQDMTPYNRKIDAHRHLFAWMVGFRHLIESVHDHFVSEDQQGTFAPLREPSPIGRAIEFVYCDANVYDGADISMFKNVTYSARETGAVFHPESAVQFEFKKYGGTAIAGPCREAYTYEVSSTKPGPCKGVFHVVNGYKSDGSRDGNDTAKMEDYLKKNPHADMAVPAALKRAGDWGQVEHCILNGVVLVTCDRFLAFYAVYRDVNVLLVRHKDALQEDDAGNKFVQYSFAMRRDEELDSMAGGATRTRAGVQLALVAATIAAAFLGSA